MKNKDTKKWVKRICAVVFFGLILIVAVPIIINECYKTNSGYITMWTASDMLSYYGMILAACGTVAGVFLSIKYSQKQYKEDAINRIRPYITLNHIKSKSNANLLTAFLGKDNARKLKDDETDQGYIEYKLDHIYIIIGKDGIEFRDKLDDNQKDTLRMGGFGYKSMDNGGWALVNNDYISLPFEATNVGNGAATNLLIAFYRKNESRRGVKLYTLNKNESVYFHIFSNSVNDETYGEYVLELEYGDIVGTRYSQRYPIGFYQDENTNRLYQQVDFEGKQIVKEANTLN